MKIGIVGAGMVGATAAYTLVVRGIGTEIVIIDIDESRAQAEAADVLHAAPFSRPTQVRAGDYSDLSGSRLVIVTAGAAQKPGQTRLDLLKKNAEIYEKIAPSIIEHAPLAVYLVVTNPLDVMTHLLAARAAEAGIPKTRVIGSGTTLDTARFRALLGQRIGVAPQHVHAYVIGEHGDSEVMTWSTATVSGLSIREFCDKQRIDWTENVCRDIEDDVRKAAYHIIDGKGATYYGISSALARIAEVVLYDQRAVMTVSTPIEEVEGVEDVSLSLPRLLGDQGVRTTFPLPLNDQEKDAVRKSAEIIREGIEEVL
jgi:L-lactate dehydrogenase